MATTDDSAPETPAAPKAAAKKRAPAKNAASNAAPRKGGGTAITPATKPVREEAGTMIKKIKTSARDAAHSGKEKTTNTLDDVSAMVEDVARTIDERVGPEYGAYARKAAEALAGVSESLKSKEVEDLLDDARDFIRRKPAVAIGAAAAIGFVLTRLLKADDEDQDQA